MLGESAKPSSGLVNWRPRAWQNSPKVTLPLLCRSMAWRLHSKNPLREPNGSKTSIRYDSALSMDACALSLTVTYLLTHGCRRGAHTWVCVKKPLCPTANGDVLLRSAVQIRTSDRHTRCAALHAHHCGALTHSGRHLCGASRQRPSRSD
jgi:hypothetical protein